MVPWYCPGGVPVVSLRLSEAFLRSRREGPGGRVAVLVVVDVTVMVVVVLTVVTVVLCAGSLLGGSTQFTLA